MVIEKWRPAKAGDNGIARFKHLHGHDWVIGRIYGTRTQNKKLYFWNGIEYFDQCQVLVEYRESPSEPPPESWCRSCACNNCYNQQQIADML